MQRKWRGWVGSVPIVFGATNVGLGATAAQNSLESSTNWSGYVASAPSGSAFSDVSSTWVIPTVKASSSGTTYSAYWVGFDGDTDGTVEQCGTSADVTQNGTASYYAWYEFYPSGTVELNLAVHPGDTINAEVKYEASESSSGKYAYYMDVNDQTTGKSFTDTLYTSSSDARSSAEWIAEAPSNGSSILTLANFGSVSFSNDVAALNGGSDQALGALNYNDIEMVQNGNTVALPTSLYSGGEAFTVNYGTATGNLTWNNSGGSGDGKTWDVGANHNWNNGDSATVYTDGSNITFNDTNNNHYSVTLNSTVSPGSVTVNNNLGNYTISGAGKIADAGAFTKSGSDTVTVGAALSVAGSTSITAGTLQLAAGVSGESGPAATSAINLASLSITGNGVLDVNNNNVILTYGSSDPISTIAGYLATGYSGGAWNGLGGIDTSAPLTVNGLKYGLGYADGADGVVANLTSGQIEVAYTLVGDAKLDGNVNGEDLAILAANFNQQVTGWDQGDFTYSGTVNGEDFTLLAANFNQGDSGAATAGDVAALDAFAAANDLSLGDVPDPANAAMNDFAVANGISLINIPEPASATMMVMAGLGIRRRRRRSPR
jgi:autotransporter-associated beta strand protein